MACLLLFPAVGWAQQDSTSHRSGIALGISTNAYRGDLGKDYDLWTAAYHVSILLNQQRRFHGSLHMGFGHVTGQAISADKVKLAPSANYNSFFRSTFVTVHYGLHFNIIRKDFLRVYLSQGIGLLRFMPQDQFNGKLQEQPDTRAANETYGNVAAVLPTQLGVHYYFPNHFGVGIKAGWLNTTTDYLDNIAQLGRQQGNDNVLQFQFMFLVPAGF